jgi:hypothetical protein
MRQGTQGEPPAPGTGRRRISVTITARAVGSRATQASTVVNNAVGTEG